MPFIDPFTGDPLVGAQVRFYNANTTTPRAVYTDTGLNVAHAQPVLANAYGMFPAIYLQPGNYRVRMTTPDGEVLFDLPDVPTPALFEPPSDDPFDTPIELLFRTGMMIPFGGDIAPSGWVTFNGTSIGSDVSGATGRANPDTEDLFLHLWDAYPELEVFSGRGDSAPGDWAANKWIATPDLRGRTIFGRTAMGAAESNRIAASLVTGDRDVAGSTVGDDQVTLSVAQIPQHNHGGSAAVSGTAASAGAHTHNVSGTAGATGSPHTHSISGTAASAGAHNHGGSTGSTNPSMSHSHSIGNSGTHTHPLSEESVTTTGGSGGVARLVPGSGRNTGAGGQHNHGGSTGNTNPNINHDHSISSDGAHTHSVSGTASATGSSHTHNVSGTAASAGAHTHDVSGTATIANQGGGGAHNNMPPGLFANWIGKL